MSKEPCQVLSLGWLAQVSSRAVTVDEYLRVGVLQSKLCDHISFCVTVGIDFRELSSIPLPTALHSVVRTHATALAFLECVAGHVERSEN